jgi:hypothetical protein
VKRSTQGAGAELLKNVQIVSSGQKTGLETDKDIIAGIAEDAVNLGSMDHELDVEQAMIDALESMEGEVEGKIHPIGNGRTVPYPYDGEPTLEAHTCSKPIKDVNRGCNHYGVRCRLPMLADKLGEDAGPYNVRYIDLRTKSVKTCFCTTLASTYLRLPNIVLLPPSETDPPGETWVPTRDAEYTPLPNGQMPMPGPNTPKTPIKFTGRKTRVPCHPSREMTRLYQQMRRKGDFDQNPSKVVRAARARVR